MWVNYLIQEASLHIHAYGVNIVIVPAHDDLISQVINL
jgi:hypothetical protein